MFQEIGKEKYLADQRKRWKRERRKESIERFQRNIGRMPNGRSNEHFSIFGNAEDRTDNRMPVFEPSMQQDGAVEGS
jgi:hypothetical protein